jgi:hypothetical protein
VDLTDDAAMDNALAGRDAGDSGDSGDDGQAGDGETIDGEGEEGEGQDDPGDDAAESEAGDGEEEEGATDEGDGEEGDEEAAAAAAAKAEAEKDPNAGAKPLAEAVVPPEIKGLFKLPNGVGNKVKDLFFRDAAYREVFPTVAEAREIRELVPDVESAKKMADYTVQLEDFDNLYYNPDPAQQGEFIQRLFNDDPEAFGRLMEVLPSKLYELAPAVYRKDTETRIQGTFRNLHRMSMDPGMDPARAENLRAAIDVLSRHLFQKPFAQLTQRQQAQDPAMEKFYADKKAFEDRVAGERAEAFTTYFKGTNEHVVTNIVGEIRARVDELSKGTAFTDKAKVKMVREIYEGVDAQLKANRVLRQDVRRMFREAQTKGMNQERQQAIVKLLAGRGKLLIARIASNVVNEYTTDILGANKGRLAQQRIQQTRKDITGGGGGVTPRKGEGLKGVTSGNVDWSKTSEDDVLDQALGTSKKVQLKR